MNDHIRKLESIVWLKSNGYEVDQLGNGMYCIRQPGQDSFTVHRSEMIELVKGLSGGGQ